MWQEKMDPPGTAHTERTAVSIAVDDVSIAVDDVSIDVDDVSIDVDDVSIDVDDVSVDINDVELATPRRQYLTGREREPSHGDEPPSHRQPSRMTISDLLKAAATKMGFHLTDRATELAVDAAVEENRQKRKTGVDQQNEPDATRAAARRHPPMKAGSPCQLHSIEAARTKAMLDDQQTYRRMRNNWRNQVKYSVWVLLYFLLTVGLYVFSVLRNLQNNEAIQVFGYYLSHARACGLVINANATLVLIPVSRRLHTWLQSRRRLRKIFAFDASLDAHKLFGGAFLVFGVIHTLLHVGTYYEFTQASDEAIEEFFGAEIANGIPSYPVGRLEFLLKHRASITGFGMLLCMGAAAVVLSCQRSHFNRFWYLHHLLVIALILMCFHGSGMLVGQWQTKYWLVIPLVAYLLPRISRELFSIATFPQHVEARGSVLALTLAKPSGWERSQKAGMYAMVNIPSISRFEWHPFTISSAPNEEQIKFHISCVGDWTKKAKKILVKNPVVTLRLEGPFGAPCQGSRDFEVVVLIGAGIGVTPMMSTLTSLLHRPGKMKRVFFYWTTRESSSFSLFSEAMDDLFEHDVDDRLEIRHFLTSASEEQQRDIPNSSLFRRASERVYQTTDVDIRLGHRSKQQLQIGRPHWECEFGRVLDCARDMGLDKAGVFLCGPEKMAHQVQKVTSKLSSRRKERFVFTKEIF